MTPEDISAFQSRGDALAAEHAFRLAVIAHPQDATLCFRLVRTLRQMKADTAALRVLEAGLVTLAPAHALLLEHSLLLLALHRPVEAEAAIDRFAAAQPQNPEIYRLRGELAAERGDHAAAAAAYGAAIAAGLAPVWMHHRLVAGLRRAGATDAASLALDAALVAYPLAVPLVIEQVSLRRSLGQPDAAAAAVARLAEIEPTHQALHRLRGDVAFDRADYTAAAEAFAATIAAEPSPVWVHHRLALSLRRSGAAEAALLALDAGLAAHPDGAMLVVEQISLLRALGRPDAAAEAVARLATIDPPHKDLNRLRGDFALERGDHAAATGFYRADVAARPADPVTHHRLALSLRRAGQPEAALAVLEAALSALPEAAVLLAEQAGLLVILGQAEAAQAAIDRLALRDPAHAALHRLRGELATETGDHAAAAAAYEAATRQDPSALWPHQRRVASLRRYAAPQAVLSAIETGLETHPDAAPLVIDRVHLLQCLDRLDEATEAIARLAQIDPAHPRLPLLQASQANAQGDVEQAVAILAAALPGQPQDLPIRENLAHGLRRLGRLDEALALLEAVGPQTPGLRAQTIGCLRELGRYAEADQISASLQPQSLWERERQLVWEAEGAVLRQDYATAIACWETILATDPANGHALTQLAWSQTFSFEIERAVATLTMPRRAAPLATHLSLRLRAGQVGQFLNEFRLRGEQSRQLRTTLRDTPQAVPGVAAAMVRADPDASGPAIALITGLSRAGALAPGSAPPSRPRIPNVIHQFWNDDEPPPDVLRMMDRLPAQHPDHVYRRWTDRQALAFLQDNAPPRALQAYRAARHAAVASDIFRLAVLVAQGGIYVDADDYCRGRLDTLLPTGASVVLFQEQGWIGNNFMAAEAGAPLLRQALNAAVDAVLAGAVESALLVTGPLLITRILARRIAEEPVLCLPAGVYVQPLGRLLSVLTPWRHAAYKVTPRHWARAS